MVGFIIFIVVIAAGIATVISWNIIRIKTREFEERQARLLVDLETQRAKAVLYEDVFVPEFMAKLTDEEILKLEKRVKPELEKLREEARSLIVGEDNEEIFNQSHYGVYRCLNEHIADEKKRRKLYD